MTEVTWRTHPLYESYEVSSDGRVRSVPRTIHKWCGSSYHDVEFPGVELVQSLNGFGYWLVGLSVDGKYIQKRIHRMVCETFHGLPEDPKLQVRHLNGDKVDNRPENLCWGTAIENMHDKKRHGTEFWANKTHCVMGHEFSPENTYRALSRPKKRQCLECKRERVREWRRRKRQQSDEVWSDA